MLPVSVPADKRQRVPWLVQSKLCTGCLANCCHRDSEMPDLPPLGGGVNFLLYLTASFHETLWECNYHWDFCPWSDLFDVGQPFSQLLWKGGRVVRCRVLLNNRAQQLDAQMCSICPNNLLSELRMLLEQKNAQWSYTVLSDSLTSCPKPEVTCL